MTLADVYICEPVTSEGGGGGAMVIMFFRNYFVKLQTIVGQILSPYTEVLRQIVVFFVTVNVLIWLSAFIYGTFYYYFVPVVLQEKPVYFHFSVCENGIGICSFPIANISLTKDDVLEVFKPGQRYNLMLEMDMPESESNRQMGMFMIEMRLYNRNGETIFTSARPTSLHYKSNLLTTLDTLFFSPFYLLGYMQQKQGLHIELAPDYIDNSYNPCTGIVVELKNKQVHVYSATFKMFAQFSGLRYFLYYWPITSAIVGITWHFIMLSFVAFLSWYTFLLPWRDNKGHTVIKINMPGKRKTHYTKGQSSPVKKAGQQSVQTFGAAAAADDGDNGNEERTILLQTQEQQRVETGLRLRQPQMASD